MKIFTGSALLLFCAATSFSALAQPPLHKAKTPIDDGQGRIRYIIDFTPDATRDHPKQIGPGNPLDDGLPDWHKPEMRHFAKSIAKQFALTPAGITSWVGNSITAYLTPEQVEMLKNDERVTLLTQDSYLEFSAWYDEDSGLSSNYDSTLSSDYVRVPTSQRKSWGTIAVNGGKSINHAGKGIKVYVLDSGVGHHTDLGGFPSAQVQRFHPAGLDPVGCYAHATHVAGIIGAQDNTWGTLGVNPGVPIVSVSVTDTQNIDEKGNSCSKHNPDFGISAFSIGKGLDKIMQLIINSATYKPGIVNISLNATSKEDNIFRQGSTLGNKLRILITPYASHAYYYYGAFVVQSAGNNSADACFYAYNGPSGQGAVANDGFMVAGGIDQWGLPVNTNFVLPGNIKIPGSNYGRCVDAWAPAQKIWSLWGGSAYNATLTNNQFSNAVYSSIGSLSGTSMAAPHIAGVASYLAETQNLATPEEIESAVRATFRWFGYYDKAGYPVYMPTL